MKTKTNGGQMRVLVQDISAPVTTKYAALFVSSYSSIISVASITILISIDMEKLRYNSRLAIQLNPQAFLPPKF